MKFSFVAGPSSLTDVSFSWPSLAELINVLTLSGGYNSAVVVVATTFLGIAGGVVGAFALLRKRTLVADAVAHAALPGLTISFMVATLLGADAKNLAVLITGAAVSGVVSILCINFLTTHTRLTEDSAIGIVLSSFFGLGVVFLSVIQAWEKAAGGGLHHFIYGQTAAISIKDAYLTGILAIFSLLVCLSLLKEFRVLCFDPVFARAQGWPTSFLDVLLLSLVVLVTVIGLQSVGLILSIALLIVPASAARFWSDRLFVVIFLAGLFGGLSAYFGASFSALLPRMPTGAVIVITSGLLFFFSFFLSPLRGLLALAFRRYTMSQRIFEDHLLRRLYEQSEKQKNQNIKKVEIPKQFVLPHGKFFRLLLIKFRGLIEIDANGSLVKLTDKGMILARELIRRHRLWEEYLVRYGRLATSHVDYSADLVEHVISAEIVKELEAALNTRERIVTDSVHPV